MKEKKIYCPCCGHENIEDSLFCAMCGWQIRAEGNDSASIIPDSFQEQMVIDLRYDRKETLSDAISRSRISCIFVKGSIGTSIKERRVHGIPLHGIIYNPGNDKERVHRPYREEIIIMAVKGHKKDLSLIQANSEILRKEMRYLFRNYGIDVDIERFIFTIEEESNVNPQRMTQSIERASYDISGAEDVLDDLIEVGKHICTNSAYTAKTNENIINDAVRDMLSMKGYYEVKDQTRHGVSKSRKESGKVDILLAKFSDELAIIEALRLKYIDGPYIDLHIRKAIIDYNPLGTPTFILAYVNYHYFQSFWIRYYDYIKQYQFPETITVQQDFEEVLKPNATTRIAKVVLSKDGYYFPVYFIALKISD